MRVPTKLRIALLTDDIADGNTGLCSNARGLASGFEEIGVDALLVHRRDHEFYDGRRHVKLAQPGPGHTSARGAWNKIIRKQLLLPLLLRRLELDVIHDTRLTAHLTKVL